VKILVVAAGAVGSVFAARLLQAGHDVEVVARPAHAAEIGKRGLRIEGVAPGTFPVRSTEELGDALRPDLLLLTAKTFDLPGVAAAVGHRFLDLPPTLLPQNGLHIEQGVVDSMRRAGVPDPAPSVVRAVTFLGATLERPGVVRQVSPGELLFQDESVGGPAAAATREFLAVFRSTSIQVRTVPDLPRELWRKAIVNAAINPITALSGITNGHVLDPEHRDTAIALVREAQRAARLAGFEFSDREVDDDLERVVRGTAENRSSMLQDWDRGRPTEVEAISGEVLREAARHGVDLPATREIVRQLRAGPPSPARRAQPS
jgi:2-dehydropantoate 2-reductase